MVPPPKKRKVDESSNGHVNGTNGVKGKALSNIAATIEEKARWQGFCELESEPVRT